MKCEWEEDGGSKGTGIGIPNAMTKINIIKVITEAHTGTHSSLSHLSLALSHM